MNCAADGLLSLKKTQVGVEVLHPRRNDSFSGYRCNQMEQRILGIPVRVRGPETPKTSTAQPQESAM